MSAPGGKKTCRMQPLTQISEVKGEVNQKGWESPVEKTSIRKKEPIS